MSKTNPTHFKWHSIFFRIGLSHETLSNHYTTNFALLQHHKYSLTELDSMIPWEREIYLTLLLKHLEKERADEQQHRRR
jgi:hypothetical protein